MSFARLSCSACVVLLCVWAVVAYPPAPAPNQGTGNLPVGRWQVKFANGVVETCDVTKEGAASVTEPNRSAAGKAEARDGTFVLVFDDDRVERWTAIGKRMVVEHWYPASQYPAGPRVLGIGKRSK